MIEYDRYNLLIVSDLHLSEGRDRRSKKFSRNEDFFFDEEFARFLDYYRRDPLASGSKWHLVINGDFLDLLQVVTREGAPPGLHGDGQSYGLACGEAESVYKMGRIAEGHWLFFEALAGFVEAGNLLTVIRGNHDVEFHYRGVRQAFIAALRAASQRVSHVTAPGGTSPGSSPAIAGNVHFSDWFYYEPNQIWIEHGNRYDNLNAFECWLAPLLPEVPGWPAARRDEIDLPFGSLFVRYLFNRIERVEPFADNIKPASKFIGWMFRHHLFTALRFVFGDGRHLLARIRRAWLRLPEGAYRERAHQHQARLAELEHEWNLSAAHLEELDRSTAPSLLRRPSGTGVMLLRWLILWRLELPLLMLLLLLLGAVGLLAGAQLILPGLPGPVRDLLERAISGWRHDVGGWALLLAVASAAVLITRWMRSEEERPAPSFLKAHAARIAENLGVRYVVMGHTHDAELYDIGTAKAPRREYFNTGTWTKVFSEEERLIREDVEFIYVEGVRRPDGLRMRLLEWDDGAGCPGLLKLFRDE